MFFQSQLSNQLTFFQKIKSIDYILLLCVLVIGVISGFAMYISEGGELLYHTKSHLIRFSVFFFNDVFSFIY